MAAEDSVGGIIVGGAVTTVIADRIIRQSGAGVRRVSPAAPYVGGPVAAGLVATVTIEL